MTIKLDSGSPVYLSLREVRELIGSISDARDRLMLRVLYETGCSIAELVRINAEDLQGSRVKIMNDESGKIRYSQVSSKLGKDLRGFIDGNQIMAGSGLFSTRQGKSISERRVRQLIESYSERVFSRKINPQKFRYYHIAHAYTSGVLLENIAKQLGITSYRAFQVIEELGLEPTSNYNNFLARV